MNTCEFIITVYVNVINLLVVCLQTMAYVSA